MHHARSFRKVTLAAAVVLVGWSDRSEAQQGPVAQGLNNAGRAVRRGLQTANDAVQDSFSRTQTSVANTEIVSRVYGRLHWDKALVNTNLQLEVTNGGIATLTGIVPDAAAKAKALTLTSETVGVIQVVDQVTVSPPLAPGQPAPIVPGTAPAIVPGSVPVVVPRSSDLPL